MWLCGVSCDYVALINQLRVGRDEVETLINFFSGGELVSEKEVTAAMRTMDGDQSGAVDFEEFVEW